jgi:AcrR family transcriptional regulator
MDSAQPPGRAIKQDRSRKTYAALVETGFTMLESRDFESLSIAELARSAGYSVGAFYARFNSKDEFFDALVARHLEQRDQSRERLFARTADDVLVDQVVRDIVSYYSKHRGFWRAALIRSSRDPAFWDPMRKQGHVFASALIDRIERQLERRLTKSELANVQFAFQVLLGTINNSIMNRPGPVFMGQRSFVTSLVRTFRLVAGYDRMLGREPDAA